MTSVVTVYTSFPNRKDEAISITSLKEMLYVTRYYIDLKRIGKKIYLIEMEKNETFILHGERICVLLQIDEAYFVIYILHCCITCVMV